METRRTKADRGAKSTAMAHGDDGNDRKSRRKTAEKVNGISDQCVQTP
jgi:hypothetical protein